VSTLAERGSFGDQLAWVLKNYPRALIKVELLGVARTALGVEVGSWAWLIEGPEGAAPGIFTAIASGTWDKLTSEVLGLLRNPNEGYLFALLALNLIHSGLLLGLAAWGCRRMLWPEGSGGIWLALALMTAAYLMLVPAAAGQSRFRVPAKPFLAILAGIGWGALIHRMQPQGSRRVVVDGRKEGPSA